MSLGNSVVRKRKGGVMHVNTEFFLCYKGSSRIAGKKMFNFRIVVVKQTADVLRPLNGSGQVNVTLVDVVMRSILPRSHHPLFAQEVAGAVERHLQTRGDNIWPSWTVRFLYKILVYFDRKMLILQIYKVT